MSAGIGKPVVRTAPLPLAGPRTEVSGPPNTALAFLVAPGAPAALAALAAAGVEVAQGRPVDACAAFVFLLVALCFGGYLSALLIAVPVYLVIPHRRAIPPAAAILIGGGTAAAPWAAFGLLSGDRDLLLVAAACFGLGCVGGLAFSLVRDGVPWRGGR